MLSPDDRALVTTLLTPPPGMVLEDAIATTYTLDPITLLTIPIHLAWMSSGQDPHLLGDGIRLLEALRRIGDRMTVYADRGRMQAPRQAHALYSLLEPSIVEVRAPGKGAFHPKLWILKFVEPGPDREVRMRLGILSRNLTSDRCWDLALQLEGVPGKRNVAANRDLAALVTDLPEFATSPIPAPRRVQARRLGEDLRKTKWEKPGRWNDIAFHVLGRQKRAWSPPESSEMLVMSPFLSEGAITQLCKTTAKPVALISRPDVMVTLTPEQRRRFGRCLVLDEAAETEDGEEVSDHDSVGLHAKALLLRRGWDTHLFVGSANTTAAAMLNASNIEVWAELIGKRSQVGGIEELLSDKGLGSLLTDFDPNTPVDAGDPRKLEAETALEAARCALIDAALTVHCQPSDADWSLELQVGAPVALGGVSVSAWPLSIPSDAARPANALSEGQAINLGIYASADVTRLIGFHLRLEEFEVRFALNLPITGLPVDREAAILKRILQNREGFLRYLLLLLGEFDGGFADPGAGEESKARWQGKAWNDMTLLEDMTRAFAHDRSRLDDVKRVIDRLKSGPDADDLIPPEFLSLWEVFAKALEESA